MEVDKSSSEDVLDALARLICQLNVQNVDFKDSASLFQSLGTEVKKSFNTLKQQPNLICKDLELPENDWNALDNFSKRMTADYMKRAEMAIRRLDVTVESFFWSERIQQMEQQVNEAYNQKRELIAEWKPVGIEDVLAASDDILIVEKASSYKQRIETKSDISNFTLNEKPRDRGGRTGEIIAPVRESFGKQQGNRGGGNFNRGRGNFHRGHGNRGGHDRFEDQVKQDHSSGQNYDRGRGRGNQSGHRNRPY